MNSKLRTKLKGIEHGSCWLIACEIKRYAGDRSVINNDILHDWMLKLVKAINKSKMTNKQAVLNDAIKCIINQSPGLSAATIKKKWKKSIDVYNQIVEKVGKRKAGKLRQVRLSTKECSFYDK